MIRHVTLTKRPFLCTHCDHWAHRKYNATSYYHYYYYYYGRALARTDLTILFHVLLSMAAVLISCTLSRYVSLFRVLTKVGAFLPLLVLPMVGCQRTRCDAISSGCLRQCLASLSLLSACNLLADILQIFIEFFICHTLFPRDIECSSQHSRVCAV